MSASKPDFAALHMVEIGTQQQNRILMADRRFRGEAEAHGCGTSTASVADDPEQTPTALASSLPGCKMSAMPAD
jgi:hypothetical protein